MLVNLVKEGKSSSLKMQCFYGVHMEALNCPTEGCVYEVGIHEAIMRVILTLGGILPAFYITGALVELCSLATLLKMKTNI